MTDVQQVLGSCLKTELNINRPSDWSDFDFTNPVNQYIDANPPTYNGDKITCKASVIPGSEDHILHRAAVEQWGNDETGGSNPGPISKPGQSVWGHHLDSRHMSTAKTSRPLPQYYKPPHPVLENAVRNAKSYDLQSMLKQSLSMVDFGSFIKFH